MNKRIILISMSLCGYMQTVWSSAPSSPVVAVIKKQNKTLYLSEIIEHFGRTVDWSKLSTQQQTRLIYAYLISWVSKSMASKRYRALPKYKSIYEKVCEEASSELDFQIEIEEMMNSVTQEEIENFYKQNISKFTNKNFELDFIRVKDAELAKKVQLSLTSGIKTFEQIAETTGELTKQHKQSINSEVIIKTFGDDIYKQLCNTRIGEYKYFVINKDHFFVKVKSIVEQKKSLKEAEKDIRLNVISLKITDKFDKLIKSGEVETQFQQTTPAAPTKTTSAAPTKAATSNVDNKSIQAKG